MINTELSIECGLGAKLVSLAISTFVAVGMIERPKQAFLHQGSFYLSVPSITSILVEFGPL